MGTIVFTYKKHSEVLFLILIYSVLLIIMAFHGMAAQPQPGQQGPDLYLIFSQVDGNRNGQINCEELRDALQRGSFGSFNLEVVRLMIGIYDHNKSGTIGFQEFGALWKCVTDWYASFCSYDTNRSKTINAVQMKGAVTAFCGFQVSDQMCQVLMTKFDRTARGELKFDDFVQMCITLQNLVGTFQQYDTNRTGVITLGVEQFITLIFSVKS